MQNTPSATLYEQLWSNRKQSVLPLASISQQKFCKSLLYKVQSAFGRSKRSFERELESFHQFSLFIWEQALRCFEHLHLFLPRSPRSRRASNHKISCLCNKTPSCNRQVITAQQQVFDWQIWWHCFPFLPWFYCSFSGKASLKLNGAMLWLRRLFLI